MWAPNAKSVRVVGDWDGWVGGDVLTPQGRSGVWAGVARSATAGYRYKFAVESANGDVMLKADPMAYATECPPATASVVAAPSAHIWGDDSWMNRVAMGRVSRCESTNCTSPHGATACTRTANWPIRSPIT